MEKLVSGTCSSVQQAYDPSPNPTAYWLEYLITLTEQARLLV
jgi:hypothetical protein